MSLSILPQPTDVFVTPSGGGGDMPLETVGGAKEGECCPNDACVLMFLSPCGCIIRVLWSWCYQEVNFREPFFKSTPPPLFRWLGFITKHWIRDPSEGGDDRPLETIGGVQDVNTAQTLCVFYS